MVSVVVGLIGTAGLAPAVQARAATAQPAPDAAGTVWLCRPGAPSDPCTFSTASTAVGRKGVEGKQSANPEKAASKVDCFYVYPTSSQEKTANSDLRVQPAETAAAVSQASRFSSVCDVYAPMYRQRTATDLAKGLGNDRAADEVAYRSVLAGWQDYLAHYNHGRRVVFIGHSQGAAMLIRLLASQVDNSAALRRRMLSAIILGGNVQVPKGKAVGGSFRHIPACTSTGQTGCVIAYSSFDSTPPSDALFGIPGQGVSLQSDQTHRSGQQVVCTNPAALSASRSDAALLPFFVPAPSSVDGSAITTPWVSYPDLYEARCVTAGDATFLRVTAVRSAGDHRPVVSAVLGPTWGLHLDDVNLALGNLLADVAAQEAARS